MSKKGEIEYFSDIFGQEFKDVIKEALQFLDLREQRWGLVQPVDRERYLAGIISCNRDTS